MTDRTIDPNTDMADRLDQPGFDDASDDRPTPKVSDPSVDDGDDIDTAPIMNAPRSVIDPELGDNVVDLGMVNRLERSADRAMHITIASSHSRQYFVCASP